ncbi:protein CYTOKININ-RESPONSIVE GATA TRANSCRIPTION FACTOR 1-like [Argentina anserina]|uniref:protein CYTOKININ-RESPONSIVE GATA TRANSCRIPTION FACTOR 1-like n=1 Tax=Argentina anserina TaxID=57926 RepID=UPI0021768FB7|nr:protein CYTOKININ-RESPONSIVE GATA TRANSCRIPTION FACTOR 1-like [Potentilla anserina]
MAEEKQKSGEKRQKSCADCKTTKTPMWRNGQGGSKTLCNACGIRLRKLLARLNPENSANKGKRTTPKPRRTRPATASVSTMGSTTNPAAGNSTCTTANSGPDAASSSSRGIAGGVRTKYSIKRVRFIANKQGVVKKLRCFQMRRTNFKRTGFFFFERKRTLPEAEQIAVAALLALSGSVLD